MLLLAACSGTGSTAVPGDSLAPATPVAQATSEESPAAEPTPEATPEPTPEATPEGPVQYLPGSKIILTKDDENWAQIVVSKFKQVASYKGEYYTDKPKVKGNVYIQAYVTYTALRQNGVDYNPFDWQVFAAGEAVENYSFVTNGPEPTLGSGTLPKGRKASGWVVYEVPAKGQVLMSYKGNIFSDDAPVFEVVLRAK